jgi:hypothetical protein
MDRRQVYFRSHCFHTISEVSGEYLSTAQRKAGGLPSRFGGWTGGAWAVRGAETTSAARSLSASAASGARRATAEGRRSWAGSVAVRAKRWGTSGPGGAA